MGRIVDLRGHAMAGELDPVSDILGSLKESRKAIEKRLDNIGDKIDRLLPSVSNLEVRMTALEEDVKPLKESRIKRGAFLAGIGLASGAAGSAIPKLPAFLTALFGHVP